jgi:hypothetical protein
LLPEDAALLERIKRRVLETWKQAPR